ncbi:hypothetical protein BC832DRAFT_594141 [Gaertneriomyces semiglobifer]|nr:hypothetical protein BC832DRAFT_594141 [Gaertneriomyces semiglobifer]
MRYIRENLSRLTIPRLKELLDIINTPKSGNKPELKRKIEAYLDIAWTRPTDLGTQQRVNKMHKAIAGWCNPPEGRYNGYTSPAASSYGAHPSAAYGAIPQIPPFQPPAHLATRFSPSPFWEIEENLKPFKIIDLTGVQPGSGFVLLVTIPVTYQQRLQQKDTRDEHQILVFVGPMEPHCDSISPEWPQPCELWVNKEKTESKKFIGLKGKPWTGQPANITRFCSLKKVQPQHIELRVGQLPSKINAKDGKSQRLQPRKYLMQACIVKRYRIEDVVARIRTERMLTKDQVLEQRRQQAMEDSDDVIATSDTPVPLRDPTSFLRMKLPSRHTSCTHIQCFDLETFLILNDTVPTWSCPICSRMITWEGLIVDGYVMDILASAPEDTEEVLVRPDFTWHLPARKDYSATNPPKSTSPAKAVKRQRSESSLDAIVLDSEDEESSTRHTEPPTQDGGPTENGVHSQETDIIDLTLSDDEAPTPPAPAPLPDNLPVRASFTPFQPPKMMSPAIKRRESESDQPPTNNGTQVADGISNTSATPTNNTLSNAAPVFTSSLRPITQARSSPHIPPQTTPTPQFSRPTQHETLLVDAELRKQGRPTIFGNADWYNALAKIREEQRLLAAANGVNGSGAKRPAPEEWGGHEFRRGPGARQ